MIAHTLKNIKIVLPAVTASNYMLINNIVDFINFTLGEILLTNLLVI